MLKSQSAWPARIALMLAAILALCGSLVAPASAQANNATRQAAIQWGPCAYETAPGRECAKIPVPRNYSQPGGETYDLQVARSKATGTGGYKGVLLYLPGGPAQWGADDVAYSDLSGTFAPEVLAKFDVVGINQFGVPEGVPCISGQPLQAYWEMDHTPDGSLATATTILAKEQQYNQGCFANGGPLVPHMHTQRTVQDVERLRSALGVTQLSIWATSYGTTIAHNYMAKFPGKVRAAVLDSIMDRTRDDKTLFLEGTREFERTWKYFKTWCGAQTTAICSLSGQNIDAVLATTLAQARTTPIPGPYAPTGARPANDWMITFALMWATSAGLPNYRLADAILHQAANGDASWATYIYDLLSGRSVDGTGNVTYAGGTGERRAITCNDTVWSQLLSTPASVQTLVAQARSVAPAYGETAVYQGPAQCYKWPSAPKGPAPINGAVAPGPKVLLVSGSLDAFTPLSGAQRVKQYIPGSYLLVRRGVTATEEGTGHGNVYYSACVKTAQTNLLLNLTYPGNNNVCLSDASAHTPVEPPVLGPTTLQRQSSTQSKEEVLKPFEPPLPRHKFGLAS